MKEKVITKQNIEIFVIKFYENILKDEIVSPEFRRILGNDMKNKAWSEHIELLTDFWATMILHDDSYNGAPFHIHRTMNLQKETFSAWLIILDETLDEIYDEACHEKFKTVANIMAKNFMHKLGL